MKAGATIMTTTYRQALKAIYLTLDKDPVPLHSHFNRNLLPHAPKGAKEILINTVKEGFSRCRNYTIVALPPLEVGGTLHLVHIISVGLNPDKLLIKYAGCYPFSYEDPYNQILWRDEAQNPSLQPPQHQWARSLELTFHNDSANSSYQVVSGTDLTDFTSSTSGDEWNDKTFFATADQLVGEEVTASSSGRLMKWYEPRCARCYGLFWGHSCQQCPMSVECPTFSLTPMDLPLLIIKELERMSKNDNKEPEGVLVSEGTSQRKRGTNS